MADRTLTLMAVHAHPDDEATSTGGVLAKYAAEGVQTVLVTCTDGRCGDGPGGVKPGEPGHDPAQVVAMRQADDGDADGRSDSLCAQRCDREQQRGKCRDGGAGKLGQKPLIC